MGKYFFTASKKRLHAQTIIITGASSGIGLSTAKLAAKRGAKLVLASRNKNALQNICNEINREGGSAVFQVADVSVRDDVKKIAEKAICEYGGFDTWINNAGVTIFGELYDLPMFEHRRLMEVNFWGTVYGSLEAIEHMKGKGGTIINLGSVLSERSIPLQGAYAASKFAIKAFTDTLRMELENKNTGVAVTLIMPSSIATPLTEHARNHRLEETKLIRPHYDPHLVAKAILVCAEKKRRDVIVGGAGAFLLFIGRFFPRIGDIYLRQRGYQMQTVVGSVEKSPQGNLFALSSEEGREYGSKEKQKYIIKSSPYTKIHLHPKVSALIAISIIGVIGWLWTKQSRTSKA